MGIFDQVEAFRQNMGSGPDLSGLQQLKEPGGLFGLGSGLYGGAPSGNFMDSFEARMNNPLVAAMMSAGGAMLGSDGNLGQALQAGVGGGMAGAMGAARMNRQSAKEKEREDLMRQLVAQYSQIGMQAGAQQPGMFGGGPPGGFSYPSPGGR